ncbi:Titin [Labeo rohita]|uniref:Titin n=1 Tax=Labeo rohita TaxID=84645 RepID=A0ABQ8LTD9_LABRO|nr:Titin [Labeo rohita]
MTGAEAEKLFSVLPRCKVSAGALGMPETSEGARQNVSPCHPVYFGFALVIVIPFTCLCNQHTLYKSVSVLSSLSVFNVVGGYYVCGYSCLFLLLWIPQFRSSSWSRGIALKDHTRDFVQLIPLTHYPDSCLCTFYRVGLNITIKAQLSGRVLSPITLSGCWRPVDRHGPLTSSRRTSAPLQTQNPANHHPDKRSWSPSPPQMKSQSLERQSQSRTRLTRCKPDISSAKVECCVEQERAMESPAHCTTAGGEIELNSGDLMDFFTEVLETHSGDLIDFSTEISTCYDHPVCLEFPPTHPLLSTSMSVWPPLSPDSPSAHPQPTTCAVGSPRVCQLSSASWLEDPSAPPPASESRTPPRPSDPAAPPRLSAPSSPPAPVGPPAPPGSLVPPAPPWSVVVPPSPQDSTPPALPRRSVPPAPLGSSLPPAPPQSSVAPAPQRTSGAPPPPQSLEPWAPPWPSGSSVSPWIFGSPSPPRAPLPAAPPLSVGPLESATLPPPWLLPPSAPLWVLIMAAVWVCLSLSCSGSLLFPPWLLPPSSPPWTLLTLVCVPLPGSRPPPKPPPTWTLYRCLSPPCHPVYFGFALVIVIPFTCLCNQHTLYKSVSVLSSLSVFNVVGGYYVCGYSCLFLLGVAITGTDVVFSMGPSWSYTGDVVENDTALSEKQQTIITGDIQCQCHRGITSVVFGMHQ